MHLRGFLCLLYQGNRCHGAHLFFFTFYTHWDLINKDNWRWFCVRPPQVSCSRMFLSLLLFCSALLCPVLCFNPGARGVPFYLIVVLTAVFGALLLSNSLGCYFGRRWKKNKVRKGNWFFFFFFWTTAFPAPPGSFQILRENVKAITLSRDASVGSASHSLISPGSYFHPFIPSPLFPLIPSAPPLPPHSSFSAVTSLLCPHPLSGN